MAHRIAVKNFIFDDQYFHSMGLAWFDEKDDDGNPTGKSVLVTQLYLIDPAQGVRLINLKSESTDPKIQAEETVKIYSSLMTDLGLVKHGDTEKMLKEEMGIE
jgi:hypothetical protein